MLRNLKEMEHLTVAATDGIVGRVRDFYFDDHSWVIRYLVVETREKLPQVLDPAKQPEFIPNHWYPPRCAPNIPQRTDSSSPKVVNGLYNDCTISVANSRRA